MANPYKKILITGAAGLIGREICKQLSSTSNYIVAVDNNWRYPNTEIHDCNEFISMDLSNFLKNKINDFDIIYHMAAINGTTYFYNIPNQVLKNNTITDLDIFEFAEQNLNCKLIYASSSEVVADSTTFPTPEEDSVFIRNIHNARWSYRIPKILSENYLVNSDIDYVIARFFNVFSEYSGTGHFIKDISDKIKNKNFELIGAEETRSFCYVADAVTALIRISAHASRDVVNIGSDEELTVIEAANILASALGYTDVHWNNIPSNKGSVLRRKPNLSNLKKYFPEFKPLKFKEAINKIYE